MRFRRRQKGQDPDRKYAAEQFKLGFHYHHLSTGDRAANLARAIAYFNEALRFFTAETVPTGYATVQSHLGFAHAQLPTGDRAANLARAIECFTQALRFFTAEAVPAEYAGVQQSLGDAYAKLLAGERMGNLGRGLPDRVAIPAARWAAGRAGAQWVYGAAGLVVGPVKWTERWIARAQRKADLRAERFLRHEEGVPRVPNRPASWTAWNPGSRSSRNASRPLACFNRLTPTSAASTVIGRWLPGLTMPRRVLLRHGAPGS